MTMIGIDVHLKHSAFAYLNPATGEIGDGTFDTCRDDLLRKLQPLERPWIVAVEACRQSPALCKWLLELDAQIHLVDAETLHAYAKLRKAKTDVKDAVMLRDLLVKGELPECYLATPEVEDRRVLSRQQRSLKQQATKYCNSLRSNFVHSGLEITLGRLDSKIMAEQMPRLIEQLPTRARRITAQQDWELLQAVYRAIKQIETEIKAQVKQSPIASALAKLPGIGPIIAFALWAEIGEIERFESAKQVCSYAGVVPRVSRSGNFSATGALPKRCNKHLRHIIVLAAQCAARCNKSNKAKEEYLRIKARWGCNTGKIAAARRILGAVFWLWRATNDAAAKAARVAAAVT